MIPWVKVWVALEVYVYVGGVAFLAGMAVAFLLAKRGNAYKAVATLVMKALEWSKVNKTGDDAGSIINTLKQQAPQLLKPTELDAMEHITNMIDGKKKPENLGKRALRLVGGALARRALGKILHRSGDL